MWGDPNGHMKFTINILALRDMVHDDGGVDLSVFWSQDSAR